ncbi:spondin domain-containing protein [Cognaticolwellia beringensis]|uniref:Spondin domain-containing protein n=1 Tax=Cognaticolwellia beringensis TaxID=1967665 RepID=A0A222GAS9_9GAMM|nr:spondin domain-containing protein [Cognaticolwellia beringensis]ASP49005.1 hypothetical protein B5D82_15240 [Cognaticolwellia beringensis]
MKLIKAASAIALACSSSVLMAQTIDIQITNLTHAQHFTPRLVIAHDNTVDAFEPGLEATSALAWLAEAGVIDDAQNAASSGQNFEALLGPTDTDNSSNTWHRIDGLSAPSSTENYSFDTMDKSHLSILAMLIPTNDAFVGLDSIKIPTTPGTYTYMVNAYDAGTELNDELNSMRTDIVEQGGTPLGGYGAPGVAGAGASPVPLGVGGMGVAAKVGFAQDGTAIGANEVVDGTDGPVHIHRNVLGDTSLTDGASDLQSTEHRWLNPVARVTITIPAP